MKKINFRKLFTAMAVPLVALGFAACSDDNGDETVDPKIAFTNSGDIQIAQEGGSADLMIESNRAWTIDELSEANQEWLELSTYTGENNATVKVTAKSANEDARERKATIRVAINNSSRSATINVIQLGTDGPVGGDVVYSENVGISVSKVNDQWPFVDEFDGWDRDGDLDQSGVEYSGNNARVRDSGTAYRPEAGSGISGPPYVTVNSTGNFMIGKINVTNIESLIFDFVMQNTTATADESPYTPTFGDVTSSTIKLEAGYDGVKWAELTYSVSKVDASWYAARSQFKIAADQNEIYIRFSGFTGGTTLRLDDFELSEGGSGSLINPGDGGGTGGATDMPQTVVSQFIETFDNVTDYTVINSTKWGFASSYSAWPTSGNERYGWHGRVFTDGSRYLAVSPYGTSNTVAYAVMAPFNVSAAADKKLTFDQAFFYQASDDTKLELVCSTDLDNDVNEATWTVVENLTFATTVEQNEWVTKTVDLSAYSSESKIWFAFRYTGSEITYRIDNVYFNADENTPMFGVPTSELTKAASYNGGDVTISVTGNVAWTAAVTSGTGATVNPASSNGAGTVTVSIPANEDTVNEKVYKVTISTTADVEVKSYEVTITQAKAPEVGDGDLEFEETFGASWRDPGVEGTLTKTWAVFTSEDRFDMKAPITYSTGSDPVDFRCTFTYDNPHIWIAANKEKEFIISGIGAGYKNMTLTYDIAANAYAQAQTSHIQVFCNGTAVTVPAGTFTANNSFITVTIDIPDGTTEVRFYGASDVNTIGYRLDNIKITGNM